MLNRYARAFFTRVLTPIAKGLLRAGISPDVVTLVGTLGAVAGALIFFPRGDFFVGTVVVTAFIFSDVVDGIMARMSGTTGRWGAFLDSTLDRLGDAAIFCGLAYRFAATGNRPMFILALVCLTTGTFVSYARAKAESLGMDANVGIVERGERLVGSLTATGLDGLGVPYVQAIALWGIAVGGTITLVQRVLKVRSQALPATGANAGDDRTGDDKPGDDKPGDDAAHGTTPGTNHAVAETGTANGTRQHADAADGEPGAAPYERRRAARSPSRGSGT
jgi:CDP-diacylglycerol--glycerol-3-phosphate 3-phosphatidyltransferase